MKPKYYLLAGLCLISAGCASLPSVSTTERPMAFHDTRLQYALVTGQDETLQQDFDMKLPPSLVERIVAGAVLPFTAASEAAFFPFATGLKQWAPLQQEKGSAK